jgi:hypothetical protein
MKYGGVLSERLREAVHPSDSQSQANLPRSNLLFKVPETDNRLKRKVLEGGTRHGEINTAEIAGPGPTEEETCKYRLLPVVIICIISCNIKNNKNR